MTSVLTIISFPKSLGAGPVSKSLADYCIMQLHISELVDISRNYILCTDIIFLSTLPLLDSSVLNSRRTRGRYLLSRSVNPADPRSKSHDQAAQGKKTDGVDK